MSLAERTTGTPEQHNGFALQYPSPEELFPGLEDIDPKLVAAYDALITTSPLRKRDPQILSEIVFQDEIRDKTITRRQARARFGGLSHKLEAFLRQKGIKIVLERDITRGALTHLEEDPQLIKDMMEEYIEGVEFPVPVEFPTPKEVTIIVQNSTSEGTRLRKIAETVLGDYKDQKTTPRARLLDEVFPHMDPADANNNMLANRHDLNKRLTSEGVGIARIEPQDKKGEAEYTYVKAGDLSEIPVGKRVPKKDKKKVAQASIKTSKKNQETNTQDAITEASLDMARFQNDVEFARESDFPVLLGLFRDGTRRHALIEALISDLKDGSLTYLSSALFRAFSDLPSERQAMNLSSAIPPLNTILRKHGIAIASLHASAPRDVPHTFYTLIRWNTSDIPKGKIETIQKTPHKNVPAHVETPDPSAVELPGDVEKPQREPVILRPGEDGFLERLSELRSELGEIEESAGIENSIEEPTDDLGGETLIPEGVEMELENNAPPEPIQETPILQVESEEAVQEEQEYPNLSFSTRKIITALFGEGERSNTSIVSIASELREGRKVKKEHVQSALFSIQNLRLPDDSLIHIMQTSGGKLDAFTFALRYPEGWTLDQVLDYLNTHTIPTSSKGSDDNRRHIHPATQDLTSEGPISYNPSDMRIAQKPLPEDSLPYQDAFEQIKKEQGDAPKNLPVLRINPRTFEWEIDGRKGKFPFGAELELVLKLRGKKDGISKHELAGKGDLIKAEKNFTNLQEMIDDPKSPTIFIKIGGGKFTSYKMNARIEVIE